jgi:trehalose-6-phosphate synthase
MRTSIVSLRASSFRCCATTTPHFEVLRVLPTHAELIRDLSSYDSVGFQTHNHLESFRSALECPQAARVSTGAGVRRMLSSLLGRKLMMASIGSTTARAWSSGLLRMSSSWRRFQTTLGTSLTCRLLRCVART